MIEKVDMSLWGRNFDLNIYYEEADDGKVLPGQRKALDCLLHSWDVVEGSLEQLKEYCLEEDGPEIGTERIDNIFRYVIPTTLYVLRADEFRVVSLLCNYRFDLEHGIALRFENEHLARIGSQDIAL